MIRHKNQYITRKISIFLQFYSFIFINAPFFQQIVNTF